MDAYMVSRYIDSHNVRDLIEYMERSYSKCRVAGLNQIIDKWGTEGSKNFKSKGEKYAEVLRILEWLSEED